MDRSTRTSWKVRATPSRAMRCAAGRRWSRSLKRIAPASGDERAGDQVEHRGLARAVRADQADDLAAARRVNERSSTATRPPKALRSAGDLERRALRGRGAAAARGCGRRVPRAALPAKQPDHAARQHVDDEHEHDAEQDRRSSSESSRDSTSNSSTSGTTPSSGPNSAPAPPSSAMMTTSNESSGIERDRRVDVGPARRHHGAGQRHEQRADREQRELGARGVDAGVARHDLVVADHAQREAEARAADQPAGERAPARRARAAASRSAPA